MFRHWSISRIFFFIAPTLSKRPTFPFSELLVNRVLHNCSPDNLKTFFAIATFCTPTLPLHPTGEKSTYLLVKHTDSYPLPDSISFRNLLWEELNISPWDRIDEVEVYRNVTLVSQLPSQDIILACLFDWALILTEAQTLNFTLTSVQALPLSLNSHSEGKICVLPPYLDLFTRTLHGHRHLHELPGEGWLHTTDGFYKKTDVDFFSTLLQHLCGFEDTDHSIKHLMKCPDPLLYTLYTLLQGYSTFYTPSILEILSLLTLIPTFPKDKKKMWTRYLEFRGISNAKSLPQAFLYTSKGILPLATAFSGGDPMLRPSTQREDLVRLESERKEAPLREGEGLIECVDALLEKRKRALRASVRVGWQLRSNEEARSGLQEYRRAREWLKVKKRDKKKKECQMKSLMRNYNIFTRHVDGVRRYHKAPTKIQVSKSSSAFVSKPLTLIHFPRFEERSPASDKLLSDKDHLTFVTKRFLSSRRDLASLIDSYDESSVEGNAFLYVLGEDRPVLSAVKNDPLIRAIHRFFRSLNAAPKQEMAHFHPFQAWGVFVDSSYLVYSSTPKNFPFKDKQKRITLMAQIGSDYYYILTHFFYEKILSYGKAIEKNQQRNSFLQLRDSFNNSYFLQILNSFPLSNAIPPFESLHREPLIHLELLKEQEALQRPSPKQDRGRGFQGRCEKEEWVPRKQDKEHISSIVRHMKGLASYLKPQSSLHQAFNKVLDLNNEIEDDEKLISRIVRSGEPNPLSWKKERALRVLQEELLAYTGLFFEKDSISHMWREYVDQSVFSSIQKEEVEYQSSVVSLYAMLTSFEKRFPIPKRKESQIPLEELLLTVDSSSDVSPLSKPLLPENRRHIQIVSNLLRKKVLKTNFIDSSLSTGVLSDEDSDKSLEELSWEEEDLDENDFISVSNLCLLVKALEKTDFFIQYDRLEKLSEERESFRAPRETAIKSFQILTNLVIWHFVLRHSTAMIRSFNFLDVVETQLRRQ